MIIPWLGVFDFANIRANFKTPIDIHKINKKSQDYALLVPIFNDLKYLSNLEFLKRYKDRVILCTTTNETPEFIEKLKKLAETHGFRISYAEVGTGKKNPWAIYNKTLLAHDAVLKKTIDYINEEYVIFIDADTYVEDNLDLLCGAAEVKKFDLASVKILPSRRKTVIEHLQGVEYDIAMQARLIYPWLTSGAGMIAKRKVMIEIMKNHSLFFNGGDIEIGKLADLMHYKIGHLPMVFYTDIPESFHKWVKQRFSWMCGMFRHSIINMRQNLKHPFHFIYFSFIIYFLYPLKAIEMLGHLYLLPIILASYIILTYIANWKVRSKWMLLFPFYALFQVLVVIWFGIYRYVITAHKSKNLGIIRVKSNPNKRKIEHVIEDLKSYSLVVLGVMLISITSITSLQERIFGHGIEPAEFVYDVITQAKDKLITSTAIASK